MAADLAGDAERSARLRFQADTAEGVARFDKPKRRYDAVSVTASARSARGLLVLASYTYSRTLGNHPGLFNPETGQPTANLTSMYDLPELMANRYGPLQIDRPHALKLDAYYPLQTDRRGTLVIGARARAESGRPTSVLAGNPYGVGESYLLPRGSGARTEFVSALDARLAYRYRLTRSTALEVYVDLFNLLDQQPATKLDEIWTYQNVNPIVGGDAADLRHAKLSDSTTGATVGAAKNPNFGHTTEAATPRWRDSVSC